jgi:hypothetical protein
VGAGTALHCSVIYLGHTCAKAIRLSVAEYYFCGMFSGVGRVVVGLGVLVCLKRRVIPTSLLGWAPAFAGATRELLWGRALLCSVIYLGHTCADRYPFKRGRVLLLRNV